MNDSRLWAVIAAGVATLAGCAVHQNGLSVSERPVPARGAEADEHEREPAGDAAEAWEWRRLAWLDEFGKVDPGAHQNALRQRQENIDANAMTTRGAGIDSAIWVNQGPNNIGGRTRSLLIDPATPSTLIAGSVGGGIWRSTNSGATWSPINDGLPNLAICCLSRDPLNANTLYAGTGEGVFNSDAIFGTGIYKSTDRGNTWNLLPATSGFLNTNRIAVSPTTPGVLLASVRSTTTTAGGLFRSTDGGNTWTQVYTCHASMFVGFHPTDGTKAVAQVLEWDGAASYTHRAVYSTNAGATWSISTGGLNAVAGRLSRLELTYAPSNPNIVYGVNGADQLVYKSTNGGQSYTAVTASGSTGSSWYYCPIWVDPTNANNLLTGGVDVNKSTDGGVTLNPINCGYIDTTDPHPDVHQFVHDPSWFNGGGSSRNRVYVCTDGGVYKSDNYRNADCDTGWARLDAEYRTIQYYGAVGVGDILLGGTQDNGTHRIDLQSTDAAYITFGGDGGFCAIDPVNPQVMYGEYIRLQIFRSDDGGNSGFYIWGGLTDAGSSATANFIAPFILDPNEHRRMLAGGKSLWRSDDVDTLAIWTAITPPTNSLISAIAVAPGDSDIAWYGLNNGEIAKSSNATAPSPAWTPVDNNSSPNPLPARQITRILIDPSDHNTVYVATGGYTADNLWKTTDAGSTWTDISGTGPSGLPSVPVRAIARHPTRPAWIYAGTEAGVFASADGGATWFTPTDGPAAVAVYELNFVQGVTTPVLLMATHGRGLWTAKFDPCPADYNGDNFVDAIDYDLFLSLWLNAAIGGDFNSDGFTDAIDYDAFIAAWLGGC